MEEIDLKELLNLFWVKKWVIIIILIVFIIAGYFYTTEFIVPEYTSTTKLVLATMNNNVSQANNGAISTTDITINTNLVSTYSELVTSKRVLSEVISDLDITDITEDELRKKINVTTKKNTEIIEISVTSTDSLFAKNVANEIADVFIKTTNEIYKIENLHVVDVAEVSEIPSNINHVKDIAMFLIVGLGISCLYVFLVNALDTTIKSAEEIENNYKVPVLVSIPNYDNSVTKKKRKRGNA